MNKFLTGFILLALSGCTGFSERQSPWSVITPAENSVPQPLELPQMPPAELLEVGGTIYAGFTEDSMRALSVWRETAEANTDIAMNLASALEASQKAEQALSEAGQAEFELGEHYREELARERASRLWDRVLWLGLGLTAIGISR